MDEILVMFEDPPRYVLIVRGAGPAEQSQKLAIQALKSIGDAAFCEIIRADLNFDLISRHNTNSELS
mgnify:CR=1 FL=1|jgi:hypothetical protein